MKVPIKRLVHFVISALVLVMVAGALAFWIAGRLARSAGETWVGQLLLAEANQSLNPQLSFSNLEYQYPRTVVLSNVRLTAEDPGTHDGHMDILVVKKLTLELAEIPRRGQPIRIQKLKLDHPELRLIVRAGAVPGYLGFSHLMREAAKGPAASGQEVRLSNIFEIQLIELIDGRVVYDPRQPGQPAMELDQINARLDVKAAALRSEAGWYGLDLKLERKPVFNSQLDGRINLDTAVLDLNRLMVSMTLGRQQDHYLPPALQEALREHEVSGQLNVQGQGKLDFGHWNASHFGMNLQLANGQFAIGTNHWPVQALNAIWSMDKGQGKLESLSASLLGGRLEATGEVNFGNEKQASVELKLEHLRLEQTLRDSAGGDGKYRGDLSGQIAWQAPVNAAMKHSRGGGTLSIVNGSLGPMPGIGRLFGAMGSAMKTTGASGGEGNDTAGGVFTFQDDRANLSRLDMVTSWMVLRGKGDVYFDQRLDLRFNGGPIEKGESLLGAFGRLLGNATDQLSVYAVTGNMDHPDVNLKIAPALR